MLTGAIEIVVGSGSEGWKSKLIPKEWTEVCEMVDVEAWVYVVDGIVNIIIQVTSFDLVTWTRRKWSGRRVLVDVSVVEICKTT